MRLQANAMMGRATITNHLEHLLLLGGGLIGVFLIPEEVTLLLVLLLVLLQLLEVLYNSGGRKKGVSG